MRLFRPRFPFFLKLAHLHLEMCAPKCANNLGKVCRSLASSNLNYFTYEKGLIRKSLWCLYWPSHSRTRLVSSLVERIQGLLQNGQEGSSKKNKKICLKRLEKMVIKQLVDMANTIFHAKFQIDIFIFEALIGL